MCSGRVCGTQGMTGLSTSTQCPEGYACGVGTDCPLKNTTRRTLPPTMQETAAVVDRVEETAVVVDWGLARQIEQQPPNLMMGTPLYASPEQLTGYNADGLGGWGRAGGESA